MDATPDPRSPYLLAKYQGEAPPAPDWFYSAIANEPEQHNFESDGAQIELLTWGETGRPGLLFLHGNSAHARWWSHIAPFFANEWRCATLSWSGMGNSERRAGGYTVDNLAREALDAAKAAGLLEGPTAPIAIGHSLGGNIGMVAASHSDSPFGGLVIIDSPIVMDSDQLDAIRAKAPKPKNKHKCVATLEEGLARFRLSPPQDCENDFIVDYIARHSFHETDEGWQWHFDPRRVTMNAENSDALVQQVRCPVAYFYGEHSAMLSASTLTQTIAALPAGTPVVGIPDAHHHVMLDQPIALVVALRALLTRWPGK